MKTVIKVFLILLMVSCTPSETPHSTEFYRVLDVTASAKTKTHSLNVNVDKIRHLFELDTKPKSSVRYSQSIISEVHLNEVFSLELEGANSGKYNKYKRLAKIKKFVSQVEQASTALENIPFDRESSNIFIALANIINKVAQNNADTQVVLIQSDMLDNSFMFSAYDKNQMKQLQKSSNFLSDILNKFSPITMSLSKMKVVIVYQPNTQTDFAFRLISQRYKAYLENKGATVEIVANL
jgi:hypothetical protein